MRVVIEKQLIQEVSQCFYIQFKYKKSTTISLHQMDNLRGHVTFNQLHSLKIFSKIYQ